MMRNWWRFALLALLVSGILPFTRIQPRENLEPAILADLADDGLAEFVVAMRDSGDRLDLLSRENALPVTDLYRGLRDTARSGQANVIRDLDRVGADYHSYWIANALVVKGNESLARSLAARPDVLGVFSNVARRMDLGLAGGQAGAPEAPVSANGVEWNVAQTQAPELWDLGFTGQGILVAGADTGVDWDHPALKDKYLGWNGSQADHNYSWWDPVDEDPYPDGTCETHNPFPCDDLNTFHGTHTLGTVLGSDGDANQIGVAPGARWMACRNMDGNFGKPSWYLACMQFFLAPTDLNGENADPSRHPDVVNNSYACTVDEGCTQTELHVLRTAVLALRKAGIFMAVSAGNSGPGCATVIFPPAIEDSVYTVGAVDSSGDIASFSSRGPVTIDGSGLRKPDLVAPGVTVRSSIQGGQYATYSGTSMAAPHVAGGVAVLWSALPGLKGNIELTEMVLNVSAKPRLTDQHCGGDTPTSLPNHTYGYGELDLLAAYQVYQTSKWLYLPVIRGE